MVPIKYQYKNSNTNHLGFGAQTTEKIVPESVYNTGECVDGYTATMEEVEPASEAVYKEVEVSPATEATPATYYVEGDILPEDVKVGDIKTEAIEAKEAVYETKLVSEAKEAKKDKVCKPNSDDCSKLQMSYVEIIPVLVKAVQELSAKVDELTNKQGDNNVKTNSENGDSEGANSEEGSTNSGGSGSEDSGTSNSASSDSNESNSDSGSSASDSANEGSTSGTPSSQWTKDQLKAYMDANGIAYNSGDTKDDLLTKIEGA